MYRKGNDGSFALNALHVLGIEGDRIADVTAFLDPRSFAAFHLQPTL
jgi:hypothetical protein